MASDPPPPGSRRSGALPTANASRIPGSGRTSPLRVELTEFRAVLAFAELAAGAPPAVLLSPAATNSMYPLDELRPPSWPGTRLVRGSARSRCAVSEIVPAS